MRIYSIILIIITAILLLFWDIIIDILLGPTKDLIGEKILNSFIASAVPGTVGSYIFFIIVLLTVLGGWTKYLFNKSKELQEKSKKLEVLDVVNTREFMKDFTLWACRKHYVISTQLYSYDFRISNKEIKLVYEDGFITEGERINAVLQEYFKLDSDLYSELRAGLMSIEKRGNKPNSFKGLSATIQRLVKELNNTTIPKIVTEDAIKYSMLYFALQFIDIKVSQLKSFESRNKGNTIDNGENIIRSRFIKKILKSKQKELKLNELTRTGILRAILNAEVLNNEFYVFEHSGQSEKSGRIYLSYKYQKNKKSLPNIFLITISHKILEENDPDKLLNDVFLQFKSDIIEKL